MASFSKYQMPDSLWDRIEQVIPPRKRSKIGGRSPFNNLGRIADGIFYKMRTDCQWSAIPRSFVLRGFYKVFLVIVISKKKLFYWRSP